MTEDIRVAAEFWFGLLDAGLSQDISEEDALHEIEESFEALKNKGEYMDSLFDYLLAPAYESITRLDNGDVVKKMADMAPAQIRGNTDYGTPYSLIAQFILSLQGTNIFNYDDDMHYMIIEDGLKNHASKKLLFYLSRGVENITQGYKR